MANFYSTLKGIPIDYLVATPLLAAARANLALAQNMEEFIFQVAYKDGKPGEETNVIQFDLTRPYTDPVSGEVLPQSITVECPLIGIVPIPALLVDNVTVDFTTTVGQTATNTSEEGGEIAAEYGFGAFEVSGKVTAKSSHMRKTNQSATYTFHVQADQQQPTEGMSKLMDVFASTVEPIPVSGGGSSSSGGGGSSSSSSS